MFERVFRWGTDKSQNDVDLEKKYTLEMSDQICKNFKSRVERGSDDKGA